MTKPLRVAVLARSVRPLHGTGGLERSVCDLVRHLAAAGLDITLIAPPPRTVRRQDATDPFSSARIRVREVPYVTFPFANRKGTTILDRSTAYPVFGWRAGRYARALARAGEIDLVHAFGASALGYAIGRRLTDPPLVLNPQGLEEFGASAAIMPRFKAIGYAPLRMAVRACARRASAIIATDHSLEPVVTRHLSPRPDQLVTIPNGLDLIELAGEAGPGDGRVLRRSHGFGDGETIFLSVGRLEHNKGFDLTAKALAAAAGPGGPLHAHGWRWVIVGAGPFRRTLEALVGALGIGGHVTFAGRAPDRELHAWYEAASVLVHATRYEGSSLVALEAMAHRTPVIATRAGGLPDKVIPGQTGWLVPVNDVPALSAALVEAASRSERLTAMGLAGRKHVEDAFAWPVLAQQTIALYERLLATSSIR